MHIILRSYSQRIWFRGSQVRIRDICFWPTLPYLLCVLRFAVPNIYYLDPIKREWLPHILACGSLLLFTESTAGKESWWLCKAPSSWTKASQQGGSFLVSTNLAPHLLWLICVVSSATGFLQQVLVATESNGNSLYSPGDSLGHQSFIGIALHRGLWSSEKQ